MAATLKLGDKIWATKEGSLLAYNSENNNFKPLPFDFTRASSATRVNKDGLIEVVTNNKPRIDFLNDSNGALLLEPTRSNINTFSDPTDAQKSSTSYASVTYQDDFNWGLGNVIENAIVFGDNSTTRYAYYSSTVSSGASYSLSFFIKMDDNSVPIPATDFLLVLAGTSIASGYTIDNYGNNVYRVSVSGTAGASNTANGILKVASHSAKTFKITGFQLEAGSYATSYIPTQGSTVTRIAEVCNNGGNDQVINSEEGVLFAEIAALASIVTSNNWITISDGNSNNQVALGFETNGNTTALFRVGGSSTGFITFSGDYSQNKKIAFKWKENDFALWIDGVEVGVDTSGATLSSGTLNSLQFNWGAGGNYTNAKVKQLQVYKTALTDAELQQLTTL